MVAGAIAAGIPLAIFFNPSSNVRAAGPALLDPNLKVRTVVTGLQQPTTMAFIGADDFLVLEKGSGQVKRVTRGVVQSPVALDLAVNSASERGLLGIAVHPDFPRNRGVYLYWSESSAAIDSADLSMTPLLGNRVDRFVWNGSTLTFEKNLIRLRAFQNDATNGVLRGNHNAGIIRFERRRGNGNANGNDDNVDDKDKDKDKLFIIIGDNGRRGQTQNLLNGPFGLGVPDDQFGGPAPDDAHLTGVILRLNDDGTTPSSNPFFALGASMAGAVGANIQKIYAYGIRNSFGMAVDPNTGDLWNQENGDDSFDEINRITPGQNNGWVQVMGPMSRIAQFKAIETSPASDAVTGTPYFGLQQVRWLPTNIANTPAEAAARLVMLRGAHYSDPVFSWKYTVSPAGIGFLDSRALGREYEGDLFVGAARPTLDEGYLFRFRMNGNRRGFNFSDSRLADGVADNNNKFDPRESETLRFGTGFGVGTDIQTAPNGNLYVVSLTLGTVYEIHR